MTTTDALAGKAPRKPTLAESLAPIVAMILFLGVGFGVLGIRIELLLILSAAATGLIAWRVGLSWAQMQEGIVESVAKAMPAIMIVIVVGALIASWLVSGTIPYIVYHGLDIISPAWFLVTACVLCSVVSVVIGTSWGTIGTVGVALIGIAQGLGVPLAPAAGAIVAGAYFGDKLSPFSDTTNLAPIAARSNLYDHIGHMLWTTTPAWLVGLALYAVVGRSAGDAIESEAVVALSAAIEANFQLGIILLLPALITLGAAVLRKPIIPGMLLSIASALLLAWFYQDLGGRGSAVLGDPTRWEQGHASWVRATRALVFGLGPATESAALNAILSRGGMESMMGATLIALCAFGFAGIATKAGMLAVVLDALGKVARTTGQLVASTVASCLVIAGVTGNSYLSILVPGELFRDAYRDRGLAAKNLSRICEDSGTVVVPLIPWSIAAVYIHSVLDVTAVEYAPWAVMCYTGMAFSLLYGFTGFRIAKRKRDDETQPGS